MADVDKKQLLRYIEIEKKIQELETTANLKKYDEIVRQIDDVTKTIETMEIQVSQLELRTKKEKEDVDKLTKNTLQATLENPDFKKQLTQEQEEYLEALNKEEVMKQNLVGLKKQRADYETNADKVKGPAKTLKNLYEERDNLLSDIFNGEYGSELENKLEAEFDELMEKKQRISVAHFKWTNARVLLDHSVHQLSTAVQRWSQVPTAYNQSVKYSMTTEVRNNLSAAQQNINSTQRYLHTINFPYCEPKEMDTLGRAIVNIYTDANSTERHTHAACCYNTTYKRATALLQWFDNVIKGTIQKDLDEITVSARDLETKLRAERVRLIRAKVEESGGNCNDLNTTGLMGQTDQKQVKNTEADGFGVVQPQHLDANKLGSDEHERPPPTPVPLCDLAPPPNQDDLFGNIDKLKSEHEKDKENFTKTQEINKHRLEQSFQSKLAERRHKKKM